MLKKAIQRLRPTLRVVVQVQQLQERSMKETAEVIGISLAAAKGRLAGEVLADQPKQTAGAGIIASIPNLARHYPRRRRTRSPRT